MSKLLQNYLRFWARRYLNRVKPKIIAVTGSVGKTSTKEAIFAVLTSKFGPKVRKSAGNLNTKTGVPLAILGYQEPPVPLDGSRSVLAWIPVILSVPWRVLNNRQTQYLVLEIAADEPGDIEFITSFVRPDVAVVTNIGPAHLEIFGSIEAVLEEKKIILDRTKKEGWVVLNFDDEKLRTIAPCYVRLKNYSIDQHAEYKAGNINFDLNQNRAHTNFEVNSGGYVFKIESQVLGKPGVYAALAAIAVGKIVGLSSDEITSGLKNLKPEKHRLNLEKAKNGALIIDDTYNANPVSMREALSILRNLSSDGKKIAVLGDMLELGDKAREFHAAIGEFAQAVSDELICIGKLAESYGGKHFVDKDAAADYLLSRISKDDIILVKASRGMGLEEIVDKLKA